MITICHLRVAAVKVLPQAYSLLIAMLGPKLVVTLTHDQPYHHAPKICYHVAL